MSNEIKGVIFDMDGLLFDTEEIYCRANLELAPQFGLKGYTRDYYYQNVGASDEGCRRNYYRDFSELSHERIDAFIQAGHQKVTEMFEAGITPLKPGVIELLNYLKLEKIPAIVASSNNRHFVDLLLSKGGIANYFIGSLSVENVTLPKPNPEIVEKAVGILNVKPNQCLMLEDSFNGVRAAHSAGVPVIMVPDLLSPIPEIEEKCLEIVKTLHDVQAFLAK